MPSAEYDEVVSQMQFAALELLKGTPTIEEQRAGMEQGFAFPMQDDVTVTPVEVNGVPAEWTTLPDSDHGRRLLYVHGGGYVMGSLNTHRRLVADICRAGGCVALSLDYRLAPEHPFPAAVDDALAGLAHAWANGPDGESEASSVFVGGDSAGGGLMLATMIAARDRGLRLPSGGIGLSAWADLAASPEELAPFGLEDPTIPDNSIAIKGSQAWAAMYAAEEDRSNPLISPVLADYEGLPPLLLQAGSVEMICRDTERVAERARAAGVEVVEEIWDDMFHVWQAFAPMLPEGQEAIDHIGAWIRERA